MDTRLTDKEVEDIFMKVGTFMETEGDITICGGTCMLLATGLREGTADIDYIQCDDSVVYAFKQLAKQMSWDMGILNDDVRVTTSYSPEILKYRVKYKTYGKLTVYTIREDVMLAMKLKSFRADSFDPEDCQSLIELVQFSGKDIQHVYNMLNNLYADPTISLGAEQLLRESFQTDTMFLDKESVDSYCQMIDDGLISIDEIPKEFMSQISKAMESWK